MANEPRLYILSAGAGNIAYLVQDNTLLDPHTGQPWTHEGRWTQNGKRNYTLGTYRDAIVNTTVPPERNARVLILPLTDSVDNAPQVIERYDNPQNINELLQRHNARLGSRPSVHASPGIDSSL